EGHSHQRALPRLHRHADRPGRCTPAHRRAADGACVRGGVGASGADRRGDRRRLGGAAESRVALPVPEHPGAALMARSRRGWGGDLPAPHIWLTLGYRSVSQGDGAAVIEWDATPDYCFHAPSGPIVHGGMVTTLLDTAM